MTRQQLIDKLNGILDNVENDMRHLDESLASEQSHLQYATLSEAHVALLKAAHQIRLTIIDLVEQNRASLPE